MKKLFLPWLVLSFLFLSNVVYAEALRGLAIVETKSGRNIMELTQIVELYAEGAQFTNVDDLGSQNFQIQFSKGKLKFYSADGVAELKRSPIKKALSLPLDQELFLKVLNYTHTDEFCVQKNEDGSEVWTLLKKKKLKARFSDLKNIEGTQKKYPHEIVIEYKKNYFRIKWLNLKTRSSS